ncbi:ABC transporter ATP-binding protein [Paenibacillus sp. CN-4]|uniref:ABC transporter ATP-binding protein n=1 Tax=Paenibacillus nanchangensis TaxID=3348343 RepID=UPI00397B8A32
MSHSATDGLRINGLTVRYGEERPALNGFGLQVPPHGLCAVIGPSGCGKSTLLRAVAGLLPRYEGDIRFGGVPLADSKAVIGLVPQNYGLLPWRTVASNLRIALKLSGRAAAREEQNRRIGEWLDAMGIGKLARRYPLSLSGGQQQRAAIARAFALDPDILLLDEPFSALDALTREGLQQLFLENWRSRPKTALFVTHDVEEAILLGQTILVMSARPDEPAELLDNPVFALPDQDKRTSEVFHKQSNEIRKVMQRKW